MDNNITSSNDHPAVPPLQDTNRVIEKPVSMVDFVFAILAFILGFLFIKNGVCSDPGIGMTVFCLLFVAIALIHAKRKNRPIGFSAYFGAGFISLFSLVFVLSDNTFIKLWTLVFIFVSVIYWYLCMFGHLGGKKIDDIFIVNLLKSIFIPFESMGQIVRVIPSDLKKKNGASRILYILIGLLIAVIPTLIILTLLTKADNAFGNLINYIFSDIEKIISVNILPLLFGIPAAMYIFGMMFSFSEKKERFDTGFKKSAKLINSCQSVSNIIICSALTPLLLVYLLFFISQSAYFLSAFESIVPAGMNSSQYAREGFFQLCTVSCINAFIIILTVFFGKRNENGNISRVQKTYTVLFSVFTVALVVTAISKMVLYIDLFGLTLKRVYATWFLLLIGILFIILTIKQFRSKMNYMRAAVISFVMMFGLLVFCDVDARIAHYNINHYVSGDLETLDTQMFDQLSDSAIPYLFDAYDKLPETDQIMVKNKLLHLSNRYRRDAYSRSYRSFNIPSAIAIELFDDKGYDLPRIFGWEW
ncbi:MAG TPA: hypothetical protein DD733_00325 [Clostridiales bacterium]|nr:hypothetical protein [Clostridiales bacterium]